ncbi:orotate phosphoribosyltransferase [Buchnera aphidicola (Takecallis taiwana)]|uniref:orotate phosphoribosyltransferase n=1 Tax=Buchnera aphidicola TaxID=9 RepID=UPI0031B6C82A
MYQEKIIQFALKRKALQFGNFKLKSGRYSPYFFNSNRFYNGSDILALGEMYSDAIKNTKINFDVIFGLAYKGIPITTAIAIVLKKKYNFNIPYFFNRKEKKTYSDSGNIIGKTYTNKNIIIIDDVITSGITIQQSNTVINFKNNNNNIVGIFVLFDRQECSVSHTNTAKDELIQKYCCPIFSIINIVNIIKYLKKNNIYQQHLKKMIEYYQKYGSSNINII